MAKNNENAAKILDYWFALDFLSQDKYPDYVEIRNKIKRHKEDWAKGKSKYKTIETFIRLEKKDIATRQLYDEIYEEAKSCGMKKWGNLTVYIGRVKREKCIECISNILSLPSEADNRVEKSSERIAWASLQLSPEGKYIEHSLSLSTILWALDEIKVSKEKLSEALDNQEYTLAVETLENRFFDKDKRAEVESEKKLDTNKVNIASDGKIEEIQRFDITAVTLKTLQELFKEIERRYIKDNIENTVDENDNYEEIYGISFQLFKDEETKYKREADNYLGLEQSYFSNDIKMVLDLARNDELSKDKYLGEDIQEYITTLVNSKKNETRRLDMVRPDNGNLVKFKSNLSELLRIQNAPLGKWPSRFMPAFMQQMAINLAIGKGTSQLFDVNGKIFSVNGPPGTGKTTLLKEIVVNNIIERACLLAEYDNPDDAFVQCDFIHGDKEENAYSKYTRHWHRLKNDEINNYSILVTSCNNAAVENISKELPKGVVGDLKALENDSVELRNELDSVAKLFDPKQSDMKEKTYQEEVYSDIYFTRYAQTLLETEDVWGLVAAPLGKKSNLSDFYKKVLYPLSRDFYTKRGTAEERVTKYKKAKADFLNQLEVVKEQQKRLSDLGDLFDSLVEAERDKEEAKEQVRIWKLRCEELRASSEKDILKLTQQLSFATEKVETCEDILGEIRQNIEDKQEKKKKTHDLIKQLLEEEFSKRNSVGIFTKLFNKEKYNAAMQLADEYKKDADKQRKIELELEQDLEQLKKNEQQKEEIVAIARKEVDELEQKIDNIKEPMRVAEKNRSDAEIESQRTEQQYQNQKMKIETKRAILSKASDVDEMVILDEKFMRDLLSDDIDVATKAQVDNPWFTQRYNREREKLFALAMRMNKEFVISSKKCRDNFNTLSQYWGFKEGDEKEKIIFHKEDRENMVASLFQTLFLLVPVMSSTFASIGTLLKDVKKPGKIGLLIVDEAGQAQPQMAIGALYRSRKAIIVGDPKQVEPVVTDDLLLLKHAYNNMLIKPYKSKTISVQSFADRLNLFGTYLDNGSDYPEWIGCPLLVHRRCISPMYEISNQLSYNGIMKQQTRPPKKEVAKKFIYDKSQWITIEGKEKGNKNHYVEEQAKKVCEMLEVAFEKDPEPSLYIISPFTTVISGIKSYIKSYCKYNPNTKINEEYMLDYDQKRIGTVHTFQGKEANEVIFLLGCDNSREAEGAIKWVNKNIVNVAATRAKFRLYVIGDEAAWNKSPCVSEAKRIMDIYAIKEIKNIIEKGLPEEEKKKALLNASNALPSVTQFMTIKTEGKERILDYRFDTTNLIQGLTKEFIKNDLSKEQLEKFGFKSMKDLEMLSQSVRANVVLGMKLFYLLEPVYKINHDMDASCCAILFCKAMELQMKDCFIKGLKKVLPEFEIKGFGKGHTKVTLKDAENKELTLGTFVTIIRSNRETLGQHMQTIGNTDYDQVWWRLFEERLSECTIRRNKCCHSGVFNWKELSYLLYDMFKKHEKKNIGGVIFESRAGTKL